MPDGKSISAAEIKIPGAIKASIPSNQEFINTIFGESQEGISALVCTKQGDPEQGGWKAHPADDVSKRCLDSNNNFFNCSSFRVIEDGTVNARKENFAACHALVLDDIGTKIAAESLRDFDFSWKLETSPGNFQYGLTFSEPVTDGNKVTAILDAFIAKSWCDAGASGPISRWMRLPVGVNGKPKYKDADGVPYSCQLKEWNPDVRYSPEQMIEEFKLELAKEPTRESNGNAGAQPSPVDMTGDIYFPVNLENPVISRLKEKGLYKTPLGSGKHDVTCPWVEQHTDAIDSGTAYFEPNDRYPVGGFSCMHSHRDKYHIQELLDVLEVKQGAIRHKPVIRTVAGEMHRIIDAYEMVLAQYGRHYHSGGLICTVYTDPETSNPEISPASLQPLTKKLSSAAASEKYDKRSRSWERCDPPSRHCGILYDQKDFHHLPMLKGLTRQPYFRESNGELVTTPGYDAQSNLFGVFDAGLFNILEICPETIGNAKANLNP